MCVCVCVCVCSRRESVSEDSKSKAAKSKGQKASLEMSNTAMRTLCIQCRELKKSKNFCRKEQEGRVR